MATETLAKLKTTASRANKVGAKHWRRGPRRAEAAAGAGPAAAGPRSAGAGGKKVGEHRANVQRRTASDPERDEHGVAGASATMVVTAPSSVAGDTVRAAESWKPRSDLQMEERSLPAREDIIIDYV